jgi:hypothetical protein
MKKILLVTELFIDTVSVEDLTVSESHRILYKLIISHA